MMSLASQLMPLITHSSRKTDCHTDSHRHSLLGIRGSFDGTVRKGSHKMMSHAIQDGGRGKEPERLHSHGDFWKFFR